MISHKFKYPTNEPRREWQANYAATVLGWLLVFAAACVAWLGLVFMTVRVAKLAWGG